MINATINRHTNPDTGRKYVSIGIADIRSDGRTFRVSVRAQDVAPLIVILRDLQPIVEAEQAAITAEVNAGRVHPPSGDVPVIAVPRSRRRDA